MTTRVADMTVEELEALIDRVLERKLQSLVQEKHDPRTLEQVYRSIEQNRWTPPPGAKSSLELLREDRDS